MFWDLDLVQLSASLMNKSYHIVSIHNNLPTCVKSVLWSVEKISEVMICFKLTHVSILVRMVATMIGKKENRL